VLANFIPGPQAIAVDYHDEARAPLLFISGSEDHLMPPAVQRSNAKHYKSNTITEIREFPGRSHLMPAERRWEEIADFALAWAKEHATHQRQAALTPA
jgi:pimeloyl-ACP methyl ester carboxylesterase